MVDNNSNSQPLQPRVPRPKPAVPPDTGQSATSQFKLARTIARIMQTGDETAPSGFTASLASAFGLRKKNNNPSPVTPPSVDPRRRDWYDQVSRSPVLDTGVIEGQEIPKRQYKYKPAINTGSLRLPGMRSHWYLYIAGAIFLAWLVSSIVIWAKAELVTLQYGDPRTTHLTGVAGFTGETLTKPTLITAVNYGGVATIFVLPASDPKKGFVVQQDLPEDPTGALPVYLSLQDVDHDGYLDLVLSTDGGTNYFWLLDTSKQQFRQPTEAETNRIIGR